MKLKLPDNVYNVLKWAALILLPACAWLYSQLAPMWGWPCVTEVPETINVVSVFLGVILGISTLNYNKDLDQQ